MKLLPTIIKVGNILRPFCPFHILYKNDFVFRITSYHNRTFAVPLRPLNRKHRRDTVTASGTAIAHFKTGVVIYSHIGTVCRLK